MLQRETHLESSKNRSPGLGSLRCSPRLPSWLSGASHLASRLDPDSPKLISWLRTWSDLLFSNYAVCSCCCLSSLCVWLPRSLCGTRVRVEHATGKVRPKPWLRRGGSGPVRAPSPRPVRRSYESDRERCAYCGERGHPSYDCPKERPRRRRLVALFGTGFEDFCDCDCALMIRLTIAVLKEYCYMQPSCCKNTWICNLAGHCARLPNLATV